MALSVGAALNAAEPVGSSCTNPILLTSEYDAYIAEPGIYWFSSWTYDLPVKVYYIPDDGVANKPLKAYVDFTCTPGVYNDAHLKELTDMADGWGYSMPLEFVADKTDIDGKQAYVLVVEEMFRELMRQFDITYNVEAKVQVEIPAAGKIQLAPDSVFRQCIESSHWLQLPDTIHVTPTMSDSVFVMPVTDWKNDSIRMIWTGKEQPLSIWLGSSCGYELSTSDPDVIDYLMLFPDGDEYKESGYYNYMDLSSELLQELIKRFGEGGLYYVKLVSAEKADFIIDYKQMSEDMARAIPMELDKAVSVAAEDTTQYYYFRKNWDMYSIQWAANTPDTVAAYFGTTPTFAISTNDSHYIGKYYLYPQRNKSLLSLSSRELTNMTANAEMDFLFVRFDAPQETEITPSVWSVGECAANSVEIQPNDSLTLLANRPADVYRIDYAKWSKGDITISWDGFSYVRTYLGDTCSFNLASTNTHVLNYQVLQKIDTMQITKDWLLGMSDRVDADGFLYFRFNTSGVGDLHTAQTMVPGPSTDMNTPEKMDFVVKCAEGNIIVQTTISQMFGLYDSLGVLISSWIQAHKEEHPVYIPSDGVYILKGENYVVQIRK